jgi:predicted RNA-binding Zn-ribbon protein involved in translation (DUF1610 family)
MAENLGVMHTRTSSSCPSCGSQETIRVTMTVAGSPTVFTTCSACEWKGWRRDGRWLALESVLDLVASR